MAQVEDDFDPGDNPSGKPTITSAELIDTLALSGPDLVVLPQMWMMLRAQRWGVGSGGGTPQEWWFEVSREIHRVATVATAVDYAQARADWLRDVTAPTPATGNDAAPETDDPQGPDVARMTVNHQAIARLMAEIQASFNRQRFGYRSKPTRAASHPRRRP
jgi:hypothetical protein